MARPSKRAHVLAKLREELGLTQEELGKRVGLSERGVQDIEREVYKLTRKNAIKISERTGVSVDWLLRNDLDSPIVNIYGKRWTNKDRQAFEKRLKSWPNVPMEIRRWHLAVCSGLLSDYMYMRQLIEGLPNPVEAHDQWKKCLSNAILKYLKTYPPAQQRVREIGQKRAKWLDQHWKLGEGYGKMPSFESLFKEEGFLEKAIEESSRKMKAGPSLGRLLLIFLFVAEGKYVVRDESLQTIKDDIDAVLEVSGEFSSDEVARATGLALFSGPGYEEVAKILDSSGTPQEPKEKLEKLVFGFEEVKIPKKK